MPSDNSDEVELNHRIVSFVHLIKTQKDTKEEIKKAQTKQKEYHDRNHQKPFLPGEQVLVKNSKRINRCGDKMVHRWTGPFTIADYIGKGVYKVNGRKTVLNAKSLRRYLTPKTTAKSQKPTAKSQKPTTKRQKPTTKRQKPTAKSQKPSAKSQTAKIQKPLKQLKTLSSNVKLHQARKTSNQPTSISKETALNDFERWLTLLPNSSLEFIVDKCSNYNMTNPRDILHFTAASLECPRLSMYLKWQKNTPSDLDQCITTLVERLKPHPLRKLPNPVKRVPAIMITAPVLLEAYSTTSKPEDVLLTLEDVPLGYSVESKFCFSKTKTKQRLHVAGHALTTADLRSLRPREWLNDQIVNAFLCLSSTESNKQAPHHSYDSLMQYKLILMPVCYKDHWFLLVARPSHRTVGVLDSMHSISRQTRFLNHWRKFMKARHQIVTGTPTSWTLEQFVSSKQADGDSCGVFVLMNAYAILHKKEPTIMRQCHVKGYRKFVSHQLFTHSTTTP
ncbi:hypothetical protein AM593_10511, partial [Mytilus galloprovincialis]